MVAAMHRAGVPFMAGTDAPNLWVIPGPSLHEELTALVLAGFTPMEALKAATSNPARFLGLFDSLGTVEEGKIADLVLLDANPLENIANTRKISAVIVAGKLITRSELNRLELKAEMAMKMGG
jgi:imidazolonepropionase-like amidohydrolase